MKRFVILKSGGGELANQLWNYLSVYAYALYQGVQVSNPSFFEYHKHFRFLKDESYVTRFFSFWFTGPVRRRSHPINKFWRYAYRIYATVIERLHPSSCLSSQNQNSAVTFLPPTNSLLVPNTNLYFIGWLFRNSEGLKKYGKELRDAFAPSLHIQQKVFHIFNTFPKNKKLIGVHIRQADYAEFKQGMYLVSPCRFREVIDEYCLQSGLSRDQVFLVITSDGKIDPYVFDGYETYLSTEDAVTDLFLLACTSIVIGSNSSFGHFASWFGDIPHVVAELGFMDWEYYLNKKVYFPNKYATLACLS